MLPTIARIIYPIMAAILLLLSLVIILLPWTFLPSVSTQRDIGLTLAASSLVFALFPWTEYLSSRLLTPLAYLCVFLYLFSGGYAIFKGLQNL